MDELNHQISFNIFKEYVTSLPSAVGALGSYLGPHPESDLSTDLYSSSTPIANMDESDRWINFSRLKKSVTSLLVVIGALSSPLGPHPESDLATYLYSGYTPIAIMDKSDHWISFNRLNKFMISLLAAIRASDSPLGPRPERCLATNLYSASTPVAIKDESNRRISFRRLQKIYNITIRGGQGIELSYRNPSKNRSRYRSILCLYPSIQL
jgi:hypothetical protein